MDEVPHLHFVLVLFQTNNTIKSKCILIPLYYSPKHIKVGKLQNTKTKL